MKKILLVVLFVSLLLVLTAAVVSAKGNVYHVHHEVYDYDVGYCYDLSCITMRGKGTLHYTYIPVKDEPNHYRYNVINNIQYYYFESTYDGVVTSFRSRENVHIHKNGDMAICYLMPPGDSLSCNYPPDPVAGIFKSKGTFEIYGEDGGVMEHCTFEPNFLRRVVGDSTEIVFDHGTSETTCEPV